MSQLHQCLPGPSIMHSVCIKEDQVSQTISFLISPTWRLKTNVSVNLRSTYLTSVPQKERNFFYLVDQSPDSSPDQLVKRISNRDPGHVCDLSVGTHLFIFTQTYPPRNLQDPLRKCYSISLVVQCSVGGTEGILFCT